MKHLRWMKTKIGLFGDPKVMAMLSQRHGETYFVGWVLLKDIAGTGNCDGYACLSEQVPLTGEYIARVLRRRRDVVKALNVMGLTCFEPRGAFYAFPCIKSTGMSSQEFCTKLLEQKHVAIIPGDAFGASGEGYCRVSYAYSVEHLTEALKRIREFLVENNIYHGN